MLLEGRNAVIYGAGGAIGGAVARSFAREGATVFLAGRTLAKLDSLAEEIRAARGAAEAAQVDALDERSVDAHADAVAAQCSGARRRSRTSARRPRSPHPTARAR